MTYYYPYSTTYLRTHMSRISRGFVVVGLAALCWVVVIAATHTLISLLPF